MLFGRFMVIIPMLALAGNLARKKIAPPSLGTFPVTTPLFSTLLVGVIVIVGALTFFPALSLGPIVEDLLMHGKGVLSHGGHAVVCCLHLGPALVRRALVDALRKLNPLTMARNPVMFVVEVGAVLRPRPLRHRRGHRAAAICCSKGRSSSGSG